jgi:hypothetical protein
MGKRDVWIVGSQRPYAHCSSVVRFAARDSLWYVACTPSLVGAGGMKQVELEWTRVVLVEMLASILQEEHFAALSPSG